MEGRSAIDRKKSPEELAKLLAKIGQPLLPMVGLLEQSKLTVEESIQVLGRA